MIQALIQIDKNQNELVSAHETVEIQMACMARLMILNVNAIRDQINMPPIDHTDLAAVFEEFHEFRQRPDYQKHMEAWYSGTDLSDLPEPEAVEMKNPVEGERFVEVEDFGGDYGADQGNESHEDPGGSSGETEADRAEDEVPEVRNDNETADRPPIG